MGLSFTEACHTLFKLAKIEYTIEAQEIKKDYKYPKPETNEKYNKAVTYLGKRKISEATCKYAGIKQDKKGNIVFEYYDSDNVLLTVKYRPARKINKGELKSWCQANSDTSPILYGMHQIDIGKPLLITEGEIGRASCRERV